MTGVRRLVLILLIAVIGLGAQTAPRGIGRWVPRLEVLDPEQPMAYFELAEEVMDAATDDAQRVLAARLFALAGVIDPPRLGRSACLALADLEDEDHLKRRLRALAWLLSDGDDLLLGVEQPSAADDGAPSPEVVAAVMEAFSLYRRGFGSRAIVALRRPGALELLTALDPYLVGGADRFLADCRLYRGGQRVPQLTAADLLDMLRLESAILAGSERTWSADLMLGGGAPLIEVDPDRLAETLGVDGSLTVYRDGRWVRGP